MDTREALAALGLSTNATMDDVRTAYRRLVRQHHPDVAGGEHQYTARLTEAYALLRRVAGPEGRPLVDPIPPASPVADRPNPPAQRTPYEEAVEAELAAGDTLVVRAPFDETYVVLFEAASRIGHTAYVDRQLGIIETIVRFEGGPSCSFLITLQGRASGTEAFCTLESIEATPTPPIDIVMEALIAELTASARR